MYEQVLQLEGIPNFRDVGGCRSRDGRRLRRGRIFRAPLMDSLAGEDLQRLQAAQLGMVCDLRGVDERARAPQAWLQGLDLHDAHVDVNNHHLRAATEAIVQLIVAEPDTGKMLALMEHNYRRMPESFHGRCGVVVDYLLGDTTRPLVIHCAAGKDRTGFLVALLLLALEIEESAIYDDYLLSAQAASVAAMWEHGKTLLNKALNREPDPLLIQLVCGVQREYLAAAIDQLRIDYGSVDAYLEQALGLTPERRVLLHRRLLE
ncbi:MAG: protein-tyrosine-phosphatase [Hydrocarboniphaga sp.]|uniref:tyrosine-protein phosphatase n=1 Tax=Hydrocarboniphaga sp. TaxID=2033016 RepID=UPI002631D415|nr:tyrosine-protein phosphatase [Hydrocarboniphaga sp.]MDB5967975.1 protein-tyrosine-phosphatase [Hydrocarboniphaga sp.]